MSTHDNEHGSELSEMQLRVRALETVLTEKGYVDPAALDLIVETYETKVGPRNGARVVARAWSDPGTVRVYSATGLPPSPSLAIPARTAARYRPRSTVAVPWSARGRTQADVRSKPARLKTWSHSYNLALRSSFSSWR